jgi:hypothetical protein
MPLFSYDQESKSIMANLRKNVRFGLLGSCSAEIQLVANLAKWQGTVDHYLKCSYTEQGLGNMIAIVLLRHQKTIILW